MLFPINVSAVLGVALCTGGDGPLIMHADNITQGACGTQICASWKHRGLRARDSDRLQDWKFQWRQQICLIAAAAEQNLQISVYVPKYICYLLDNYILAVLNQTG